MNFETSKNIINNHFQGRMEVVPGGRNRQNDSFKSNNFRSNSDANKDNFFSSDSPSIEDLRKKYLGANTSSANTDNFYSSTADNLNANPPNDTFDKKNENVDDEIDVVVVRPKNDSESFSDSDDRGERTVILSKKDGPIGAQG